MRPEPKDGDRAATAARAVREGKHRAGPQKRDSGQAGKMSPPTPRLGCTYSIPCGLARDCARTYGNGWISSWYAQEDSNLWPLAPEDFPDPDWPCGENRHECVTPRPRPRNRAETRSERSCCPVSFGSDR